MARKIKEIKNDIVREVNKNLPALKTESGTSEWGLWAHIFATVQHSFEFVFDLFRKEMDELTEKITPGTLRWYAEMARRFQNGDTLVFDEKTAMLHYPKEDESKRIIAAVAVMEGRDDDGRSCLFIKVAKKEKYTEKIQALGDKERYNFERYMEAVKFAGVQIKVSSTNADRILYELSVYHDPAVFKESIEADIRTVLDRFRSEIDFNGVLYRQKFIDAVMGVNGVVTCTLDRFMQHCAADEEGFWQEIGTHTELKAGYFDYADENGAESLVHMYSINQLINDNRHEH